MSCLPVQANPRLRANSVASALGNRTRRDPGTAVRTYHEGLKPTRRTGTFYLAGNRNFLFGSDTEDHDCTTSPDVRSNSSSGHRREVLHANPEGLSNSKAVVAATAVRTPVNLLQGLTIESRSTLSEPNATLWGTCRYRSRRSTDPRQRERSRISRSAAGASRGRLSVR